MMNGLFGSLLPPVLGDVYREERAKSLGNVLGAGRLPSGMNYYEQSLRAAQRQGAAYRPGDLANILGQMAGNAYRNHAPQPPTEREIAVKELREFLGDDLWGFGYMEGLKRDFRDLY